MVELCKKIREDRRFEGFIIGIILLAGLIVGLETSPDLVERHHGLLHFFDVSILWIFVGEAVIKIVAEGKKPWNYFKSGWNCFDFSIVVICFLPLDAQYAAVLRLARILRVLRLVTVVPRLQVLVMAIIKSIPSMFYVTVLLGLFFYIYAVMGVFLFRGNDPGHFENLFLALTTLFRVVTLEDWTDVMYTAFHGSDVYAAQGPIPVGPEPHAFGVWGILYFVTFVIVGAMVMINLFIGIVLTSLTEAQAEQLRHKLHLEDAEEEEERHHEEIQEGLGRIESEIESLRRRLASLNASNDDS